MEIDIPTGWQTAVLADVCDILDTRRIPLSDHERATRQGPIPYWGANGVIDHIDDFIFDEPLLLIAEDGGYFDQSKTRPICYLVDGKVWVNNHAHVLRIRSGNLREWVYYWFVHRNITRHANMSSRSKLNLAGLRRLPLLLPPLPEQQKIVSILTTIEEVIYTVAAVAAQMQRLKKSLLQQLCIRGIGHTQFMQTATGDIPDTWKATTLGTVINRMDGGGTPTRKKKEYWGGTIPWASVKDVIGRVLEETQEYITVAGLRNSAARLVQAESVIVAIRMAIGKAAIAKMDVAINQDLRAIQFDETIDKAFIHQWFQFNEGRIASCGVGTTVRGIRQEVLQGLPIHVPPLAEQKRIATILAVVDAAIPPAQQVVQQMRHLKHGLLSDLLAGRVRVKNPVENNSKANIG